MAHPTKQIPVKYCEHCGALMQRKRFGERLEDYGRFTRRVYCDKTCFSASLVKPVPSRTYGRNKYFKKYLGTSCDVCGVGTRLQIHHIDNDPSNNSLENIQTLCISCHTSHHHRARAAGLAVAGRAAC
jgi:5-methylcytosine-specific restriction endonuclease McrA